MINDNNINDLINKVNITNEPIELINSVNGNKAILLSDFEYRSLTESIELFSIPGFVESIIKSSNEPLEDCIQYNPDEPW